MSNFEDRLVYVEKQIAELRPRFHAFNCEIERLVDKHRALGFTEEYLLKISGQKNPYIDRLCDYQREAGHLIADIENNKNFYGKETER